MGTKYRAGKPRVIVAALTLNQPCLIPAFPATASPAASFFSGAREGIQFHAPCAQKNKAEFDMNRKLLKAWHSPCSPSLLPLGQCQSLHCPSGDAHAQLSPNSLLLPFLLKSSEIPSKQKMLSSPKASPAGIAKTVHSVCLLGLGV